LHIRMPLARSIMVCLLVLSALAAVTAGCATGSPEDTTTSGAVSSTASSTTTSESGTTTTLPLMTEYDRELAKTATIQNQLAVYLRDQQASQDDPRMGIIYGLRARTQALSGRKAVDAGDLALADTAMKDVYSTLNRGSNVATGTAAQTLADARAIIATLGAPSDNPDEAATRLDQFIARLTPLLDEATAIVPTTTST